MSGKKYNVLNLETKLNLLKDFDSRVLTMTDIGKKYGLHKSTVSKIVKKRTQIEEACGSFSFQSDRKRMRTCKAEDVDEVLYRWFKQARAMSAPLSGTILMERASEIASEMGLETFTPSSGWLDRFKKRRGIVFKAVCGESASVDSTQTEEWLTKTLPDILSEYGPNNIFNADETGLFFRCLPDRTLAFKGEQCSGGKLSKERITVLVGANMSGNEKLPLMTIGHSANPRCFKNVKKMPLEYKANKKAWMTSAIFEKWIRKLDTRFLLEGRSVALIIDNCPAHPPIEGLKAIRLVFLPPNTTCQLQPCDQGIIQSLKRHYRTQVLQKYLIHIESQATEVNASASQIMKAFKFSILDALYMLRTAWSKVTEVTIANCFRHAGFKRQESAAGESIESATSLVQCEKTTSDPDVMNMNLFDRLKDLVQEEVCAEAFYSVDTELPTCEEATITTLISDVQQTQSNQEGNSEAEEDGEDDDGMQEVPVLVSAQEAQSALAMLRKYGEQQGAEDMIDNICLLEQQLNKQLLSSKKQKTITDFFKKC